MTTMTKPDQTRSTQQTGLPAAAGPGHGTTLLVDGPAPRRGRRSILARLLAAVDSSAVDLRRFRV